MQTHRRYWFVAFVALIASPAWTGQLRASPHDEIPARVANACDADAGRLPIRVHADRTLLPLIRTMLERSETFREQCRRVDQTRRLYIRIRINGFLVDNRFRARTRIFRFQSGVIIAEVELRAAWSSEEWIAHEFEHVLEQVDGVPLAELAGRTGRVWRTAEDMFESERAIRAGRAVADETRRARRPNADGFVE